MTDAISAGKRLRDVENTENAPTTLATAAKRRRTRFESNDEPSSEANQNPAQTAIVEHDAAKIQEAISSASARAAQMSKEMAGKVGAGISNPLLGLTMTNPLLGVPNVSNAADKMAQAAEMQRQLAAQMASVSSMLNLVNKNKVKGDRKAAYRPLLLDDQGRHIDEHGNVIKTDIQQVKTLAANVLEQKKKENPYLLNSVEDIEPVDDRLVIGSRNLRAKKALKFVDAGTYINLEDIIRSKEERKILSGRASGRKAPEQVDEKHIDVTASAETPEVSLPPPVDGGVVPSMEWWDEAFLPKDLRNQRKSSRAAAEIDNYDKVLLTHCKTYKYIQHPVPIKALGGDAPEVPLPMFLTKKERKRIRKQTRATREQEKRDKMMLGLIPAPEPKFKLSNFMKLIGDQAVADPSKIEKKIMEQMQKRQLNHEMRNLAAKLTPAERKAKMIKKNQEDTSRQVHTAIFRIKEFTNPKHRFKVDVNAQQHFMSGTVILCTEGDCNLLVVEGGPRGIRKLTRLVLERIKWSEKIQAKEGKQPELGLEEESVDGDMSDDDDKEEEQEDYSKQMPDNASQSSYCRLVWRGIIPKRIFTGFKFQECKNYVVSRKLMENKGVAHYWDMAMQTSFEI